MNKLDTDYQNLLKDILENGIKKGDRTGTGTLSVFGRQIRHKMSDGFPLLTTKKIAWKTMVTELLWFLRGDTNIKYLVENGCHIWDGDAYQNYLKTLLALEKNGNHQEMNKWMQDWGDGSLSLYTKDEFIEKIKTNDKFAKKWGDLGPIYGRQWRDWNGKWKLTEEDNTNYEKWRQNLDRKGVDQISNLINELKANPDSRRLMVNAWNVGELDEMVLPPCHYGFQVYTRELSLDERLNYLCEIIGSENNPGFELGRSEDYYNTFCDDRNIPTRSISLMWNQRSCDTFLGLPFNIASYGLLLEIIAKKVNMVSDELIGNLGDTHLYLNHIEQAKEQIERKPFELPALKFSDKFLTIIDKYNGEYKSKYGQDFGYLGNLDNLINSLDISDFTLENYQSHPTIKAPLSN